MTEATLTPASDEDLDDDQPTEPAPEQEYELPMAKVVMSTPGVSVSVEAHAELPMVAAMAERLLANARDRMTAESAGAPGGYL
ncbi:hypothetical protein ACIBF5_09585 [Micromonospora sp. NPDC050417]|uniref:hypothetical protein n=1 Tax=Micromonospora sp. NPDC050417 TaxID=3364280 RepID=UPI00379810DB